MLRFEGGGFLLVLALDIFCLIDVITSDESRVRNLPKIAWFVLILLFPLIGSIVWLAGGRPQANAVGHHFGGHRTSARRRPTRSTTVLGGRRGSVRNLTTSSCARSVSAPRISAAGTRRRSRPVNEPTAASRPTDRVCARDLPFTCA
jgi:hypothetical protein